MAPNNNYNNSGKRPAGNSYPRSSNYNSPEPPQEIKAEPLPADYVDKAEQVMRKLSTESSKITTSKIRNILSLVSDIYNVENLRNEAVLLPESRTALTMMRIRIVYESGRENAVKTFVRESKLLEYLKDIGSSRQKLIDFSHYMEALVAYHRFIIGGKEG